MGEGIIQQEDIKPVLLILKLLGYANIVYFLLLYLLETFATTNDEASTTGSELETFLPMILLVITIIDLIAINKYFLPKAMAMTSLEEAFPMMLITSVLVESIGIYGLLIGLLDIFASEISLRWLIVGPFLLFSFLLQYYLIQNYFSPKLNDFIGTPNSISTEN